MSLTFLAWQGSGQAIEALPAPFSLLLVKEPPAKGTGSSPGIAALGESRDEVP